MIFWIALVLGGGMVAYIRLAPHDVSRWHKQAYPSGMGEIRSKAGHIWRQVIEDDGVALLAKLDGVISSTDRTNHLTGSVADGMVTYVTRSRVFGFPDYTTIGIYQGLVEDGDVRYLEINSRLRFGRSDLGVNRNRVKGWLAAL
jgi:hypothetical protein